MTRRPKNPDRANPIQIIHVDYSKLPHVRAVVQRNLGYLPEFENPLIGLYGRDMPDIQSKAMERYGRRVKL
jgi:hypothetical protein